MRIVSAFILLASLLGGCHQDSNSSVVKGVIGVDDSQVIISSSSFAENFTVQVSKNQLASCNGVRLRDGRFLTANHCLKFFEFTSPLRLEKAGFVDSFVRYPGADLAIGRLIGRQAPSTGIAIFDGAIPSQVHLEAHWFDISSQRWKISRGVGTIKDPGLVLYDLDMKPGASGSGLYLINDDGSKSLFAIHLGFDSKKQMNVGVVVAGQSLELIQSNNLGTLDGYIPEISICAGWYEKGADGKLYYEEVCSDGSEGSGGHEGSSPGGGPTPGSGQGGIGGNGQGGAGGDHDQGGNTSTSGGQDGQGTSGSSSSGGVNGGSGTGEGDSTGGDPGVSGSQSGGGIIIGGMGGRPGGVSGPDDGIGGSAGRNPGLKDGTVCFACSFYGSELDRNILFKPECDEDGGWGKELLGDQSPVDTTINIKTNGVAQAGLTDALKAAADALAREAKWNTPAGMPAAAQEISDEVGKKLKQWFDAVLKSLDDYYALMIANAALPGLDAPNIPDIDVTEKGIAEARAYLDAIKEQIERNPGKFIDRQRELVKISHQFVDESERSIKNGDRDGAKIALHLGLIVADAAISFTPGIGWAKDAYEAYYGKNLLTGEKLSKAEWALAVAGVASVGVASKFGATAKAMSGIAIVWGRVAKAGRTLDEVVEIEHAVESVAKLAKATEEAGVSAGIVQEGVKSTQKVLAEGRHLESVAHDGRTVYKLKDLEQGVPKFVNEGAAYKSVREKIAEGWTNKDLMKSGKAPIGSDGKWVNLHHVFGAEPGAMIEMQATAHASEFAEFHKLIRTSFRKDPDLAAQYETFRRLYWINRGNSIP